MFGKGGGALSTWIKEFCELVFIQTLQAFIFAIVIGFICTILIEEASLNSEDRNLSIGIICVIALTAIFKVEDLLRRIFGFGPTKADHGNAMASLAKTGFALQLGKKVLDNGSKLLSGAGAVIGSHTQKVKAKKDYLADLDAYNKDNKINLPESKDTSSIDTTEKNKQSGGVLANVNASDSVTQNRQKKIDAAKRDKVIELQEDAAKARSLAMEEKDPEKKKALIAQAKQKLAESKAIDDTLKEPANDNSKSASNTNNSSPKLPKDYHQKMRQFENNYKKELKEIDKKKKEGWKNLAKGVLETGAAGVGFVAGGVIGGADGDLKGALDGAVAGMGVGDSLASGTVDISFGVGEFLDDRLNNAVSLVEEYSSNVKESYQSSMKNAQKEAEQIDKQTQESINNINKQAQKQAKNVTAGYKVKSALKSVGGGAVRTVKNHSVISYDMRIAKAQEQIKKNIEMQKPGYSDRDELK